MIQYNMLNYILQNCSPYSLFQFIWVFSFSILFTVLYFMSKYSYEFSYYFGIMVSSVFAFGVALYILFISLYAILDIYSKIYTFSALLYKYGLSDAATICFKDFAYRFVEASRVDMRKAVVDAPKFIYELSNFYIKNRSDFANFVIMEKPSYYPIKLAAIYNGEEISNLLKVIEKKILKLVSI